MVSCGARCASHELGRRDVVELVGVDAQEPVAVPHVGARLMEHPAAQARLGEVDGVPAQQAHPVVPGCEVADDIPGIVDAAGVEDVDGIGPGQKLAQTLPDDVGLVADRKQSVESHDHGSRSAMVSSDPRRRRPSRSRHSVSFPAGRPAPPPGAACGYRGMCEERSPASAARPQERARRTTPSPRNQARGSRRWTAIR